MLAAICTRYGLPDVIKLKEIEQPKIKDNEVLVKVHATTVSSGDCVIRDCPGYARIIFGLSRPRKPILGTELSGEVVAVGQNVTQYKTGDQVFALTGMKLGAHAEYISLPEKGIFTLKPENASYIEAAAIAFGGTSALHFLRKGKIKSGKKVLIYGASGAVGTYAVQLARYFGAEVTAVCSTNNIDLVHFLGAHHAIDYVKEDLTRAQTAYDLVFDAVGKNKQLNVKKILAKNGIYISVTKGFAREKVEDLIFLKELYEAGEIKAVVDRVYPFNQIVNAYEYVEIGHKRGNVVLNLEESY